MLDRDMSELKPTIENPFAEPPRKRKPAIAKPVFKDQKQAPPKLSFRPDELEEEVKDYHPGYYVSQASKRAVRLLIESGELHSEDLPMMYNIAALVAYLFKRPLPTLSDVEVAAKFKTWEQVEKVAKGEEKIDMVRREIKTMEIAPKGERIKFWQTVAERLLEERADAAKTSENTPSDG